MLHKVEDEMFREFNEIMEQENCRYFHIVL